jgi:hypothetical protein
MSPEERQKADMTFLQGRPEFARFLWRVIQSCGIFSPTTDGSVDRHLAYDEGRRNLGLEILAMAEQGQPASHPNGQPILTILQVLREEANQPQEKAHGRSDRYDRNRDLDDDG